MKVAAVQVFVTWRQQQEQQQPLCPWSASSSSACDRSAAGSSRERGTPGGDEGWSGDPAAWEATGSCPLWDPSRTAAGAERWHSRRQTGRRMDGPLVRWWLHIHSFTGSVPSFTGQETRHLLDLCMMVQQHKALTFTEKSVIRKLILKFYEYND